MLVAYIDETGTHSSSLVAGVCGFIGTAIEWVRLERPWASCLARCKSSVFHATECEEGEGEYFGKSRGIRDALLTGLTDELINRRLSIVSSMVAQQDWNRCASAKIKKRFKTPYHFCFEAMIQRLCAWSREYGSGEPVALVFADQPQYRERAIKVYEHYRYGIRYPQLGSLSFEKPQQVIPLQAADLLSYWTYQYMKRRIKAGTEGGIEDCHPALVKLIGMMLDDPKYGGYLDCQAISALKPESAT